MRALGYVGVLALGILIGLAVGRLTGFDGARDSTDSAADTDTDTRRPPRRRRPAARPEPRTTPPAEPAAVPATPIPPRPEEPPARPTPKPAEDLAEFVRQVGAGKAVPAEVRQRLIAAAPDLLDEIEAIVLGDESTAQLRAAALGLLDDARNRGDRRVTALLLRAVQLDQAHGTARAALAGLRSVGDEQTAIELEQVVPQVERVEHRRSAVELAARLAGERANELIGRVIAAAEDDESRVHAIGLLATEHPAAALEALAAARGYDAPVRAAAARKLRLFKDAEAEVLREAWAAEEEDEDIVRLLGGDGSD